MSKKNMASTCLALLFILSSLLCGAIPATERAGLVALYQATNGNNWTNHTGWLDVAGTEGNWFGVTVTEDHVTGIHLYYNNLTGHLPVEIGNLSHLQTLTLNYNFIGGPIPSTLGNLGQLTTLNVLSNKLSGPIPVSLGNLSHLTLLDLSENLLTGHIPVELGQLGSLTALRMGYNLLDGPIPASLANLTQLRELSLYNNYLSGPIPPELGNLQELKLLHLMHNLCDGPIPKELGNLGQLQLLYLGSNLLSGPIPPELGNLGSLVRLYLMHNQFTGTIPKELANLPYLEYLYLYQNQLSGSIPTELANLPNLRYLDLETNQLSGSIPPELGHLPILEWLDLGRNQLTGSIPPELGNLAKLDNLRLDFNQLSGTIPKELGNLSRLAIFTLHANRLEGSIPAELGNLGNLGELYLSQNRLSGPIPPEIGNLSRLLVLRLNNNKLSGEIPPSLAQLDPRHHQFFYFFIYDNCLTATDPTLIAWLNAHEPDWALDQDACNPPPGPSLTLHSPNGGENWMVGSRHTISWSSSGVVGDVHLQYSTTGGSNWTTIVAATPNDGTFSWTVPDTLSSRCKIKISEALDGTPFDTSNGTFAIIAEPTPILDVNRKNLHFSATPSGFITGPQQVWIKNKGTGTMPWTVGMDASWLHCTPLSGSDEGILTVSVDITGLAEGTYTDSLVVTAPNAQDSPQTIQVRLDIIQNSRNKAPIGELLTPLTGAVVSGSIPVTGWALDDTGVNNVKLYREDEQKELVWLGDAVFIEGARPDIETAFPDYPFNYKAGWGYMLLSHFLPHNGNGEFTLHAIATDMEGNTTSLGTTTIRVNNADSVKPFGTIDTPVQGGVGSGKAFINWGWALTPQPNAIPTDGSTIQVWVDSIHTGHVTYNLYREDIATLFPGYLNTLGAVGYFTLDTTAYANGLHTLQWTVTDSAGNSDGIGSRYFMINNTAADGPQMAMDNPNLHEKNIPIEAPQAIPCSKAGISRMQIKELELLQIQLAPTGENPSLSQFMGYLNVNNEWEPLPIGSTLDKRTGLFSWQPAVGFLGEYHLAFIEKTADGQFNRKEILVTIVPKFSN